MKAVLADTVLFGCDHCCFTIICTLPKSFPPASIFVHALRSNASTIVARPCRTTSPKPVSSMLKDWKAEPSVSRYLQAC